MFRSKPSSHGESHKKIVTDSNRSLNRNSGASEEILICQLKNVDEIVDWVELPSRIQIFLMLNDYGTRPAAGVDVITKGDLHVDRRPVQKTLPFKDVAA